MNGDKDLAYTRASLYSPTVSLTIIRFTRLLRRTTLLKDARLGRLKKMFITSEALISCAIFIAKRTTLISCNLDRTADRDHQISTHSIWMFFLEWWISLLNKFQIDVDRLRAWHYLVSVLDPTWAALQHFNSLLTISFLFSLRWRQLVNRWGSFQFDTPCFYFSLMIWKRYQWKNWEKKN